MAVYGIVGRGYAFGQMEAATTGMESKQRRPPLYALLAANGISQVGNSLSFLALPWFVLQVSGSATKTAITVAAGTVPLVLTGLFGGALVDRAGYRRMSILSDVASAVAVAAVPALYHTVGLAFWQLVLLVFLGAVLDSPGATARRSLYPDLAHAGGVSLERANAVSQIVYRSAGLAGPPLAGVLIAVLGASNVLWLDAATFLVSAAIVGVAVPARLGGRPPMPDEAPRAYVADVVEGLRFIRRERVVLALTATMSLGSLLAEPLYPVVLPVYAREVYGSALDLGVLFAALAGGSILGNVLYLWFAARLSRRLLLVGGFAVRALMFWVLVALPPLWLAAASIVLNATFFEPVNPVSQTVLQERIPAGMRGRVFGGMMALGGVALPLGIIVYGSLLDIIGLRPSLLALAAVNLLLPLWMFTTPAFRGLGGEVTAPTPSARGRAAR